MAKPPPTPPKHTPECRTAYTAFIAAKSALIVAQATCPCCTTKRKRAEGTI